MGAFLSIRCSIPSVLEEELPTLLFDVPVLGTEIGVRRGDRVAATVYLAATENERIAGLKNMIAAAGGECLEVTIVEEEDWLADYRRTVRPFEVGETWWVDPHPDTPTTAPPGRRRLVIPPRMAFGSGSHESTRLILGALEGIDLRGRSVLDVGTGSGILSLASEIRGASRVLAVDIDPVAVQTARQIRDLQEWSADVHYAIGSAGCALGGVFDLVLCNMISAHSIPLLDAMTATLAHGGVLLLSGLLASEAGDVTEELASRGLRASPLEVIGDWASLSAGRSR